MPVARIGVVAVLELVLQPVVGRCSQGVRVVLRIGKNVDVVRPVRSRRQLDLGRSRVARAGAEAARIGMHRRPERARAMRQEHRVRTEVDRVHPSARARPHRAAKVGDGPGDGGLLAGEILRLGLHTGHLQVCRKRAYHGGLRARVVRLVQLADIVEVIGLDDDIASRHRSRELQRLADAVAFAIGQGLVLLVRPDQPALAGRVEIGVVGDIDAVGPSAAEQVAAVLYRVAEAVAAARIRLGQRGHLGRRQVGRRDAQYADRPRLVVVVVGLGGVVRIDVRGERVLQDGVVGVAPHGDVVVARQHPIRNGDLRRAEIVLADGQVAFMRHRPEQDVSLVGAGTGLVARQPDRIGPAVQGRGRAARGGAAAVRDLVAHLDTAVMHRLVGRHHVARHQIAERDRIDVELRRLDVVAFARILVEVVVGVGDDNQIGIAAIADGDIDRGAFHRIAFARRERRAIVEGPHQQVVAAQIAVEREVDFVLPASGGCDRTLVGDGVAHRRAGSRGHLIGHDQRANAQIRSRVQTDFGGGARVQGVVVARRAEFIHPQIGVGGHADDIQAFDLGRQPDLLGAGVAYARLQAAVVAERAQAGRTASAVGAHQHHAVGPHAFGLG